MYFFIVLKVNTVVKALLYQKKIPVIVCILLCIPFLGDTKVHVLKMKYICCSLLCIINFAFIK